MVLYLQTLVMTSSCYRMQEEFAPMVMGPERSLESIDLAAIFASYREYVAVKETDKQTPEVSWRSHLEEHKNMMCCVSTMFLALCYATGALFHMLPSRQCIS